MDISERNFDINISKVISDTSVLSDIKFLFETCYKYQ